MCRVDTANLTQHNLLIKHTKYQSLYGKSIALFGVAAMFLKIG